MFVDHKLVSTLTLFLKACTKYIFLTSLLIIKIYKLHFVQHLVTKNYGKNPYTLTLKSAQLLWTTVIYFFVYLLLINIDCL